MLTQLKPRKCHCNSISYSPTTMENVNKLDSLYLMALLSIETGKDYLNHLEKAEMWKLGKISL